MTGTCSGRRGVFLRREGHGRSGPTESRLKPRTARTSGEAGAPDSTGSSGGIDAIVWWLWISHTVSPALYFLVWKALKNTLASSQRPDVTALGCALDGFLGSSEAPSAQPDREPAGSAAGSSSSSDEAMPHVVHLRLSEDRHHVQLYTHHNTGCVGLEIAFCSFILTVRKPDQRRLSDPVKVGDHTECPTFLGLSRDR